MAHWARVNKDNIVTNVVVTDNSLQDEGYQWLVDNFGGTWIKTSYNHSIRKNYAGVGFTYDKRLDAFIPPKPYASWVLNKESCQWEAPMPKPNDSNYAYAWDEELTSWIIVNN